MYNGIGRPSVRGTGTSGYVQKNLAHIKKTRQNRPDIVDKPKNDREPNMDIILHQMKRKIEAKCFELRKSLESEGWNKEEIDRKVNRYRQRKLDDLRSEESLTSGNTTTSSVCHHQR